MASSDRTSEESCEKEMRIEDCRCDSPLFIFPSWPMCQMPSSTSSTEVCPDRNSLFAIVLRVELDMPHGFLLCLEDHLRSHSDWAIDSVFWFAHDCTNKLGNLRKSSPSGRGQSFFHTMSLTFHIEKSTKAGICSLTSGNRHSRRDLL